MPLSLRLQPPNTLPDGQTVTAMVGDVLTIGRGEENDLVLPDPERTLSKRHCVVEHRGGDYVITDISTNGTFLNYSAERLDHLSTPLNNGDVIIVGSYELIVEITADATAELPGQNVSAPLPPLEEGSIAPPSPTGGFDGGNAMQRLDDLSETGPDFLDDLLGQPAQSSTPPMPSPDDLDGLLGPAPSPDTSRGLADGSSAPNHSPATQDHFAPPQADHHMIPEDWSDSLIGSSSAPQAPATPDPTTPPTPATDAGDAAIRAFFQGAGAAHLAIPPAEMEATMARMGQIMAAVITGMRDILMTRAALKSEMRMDRTMINAGGNNPLKFSVSAEQAIEAMIRPSVKGYLEADAAITEALNDIKAHEVATMSGMEAALKDLLFRLGPEQLSARIEAGSTLGNLLGGKKARYWEAYEKMYAQIARETEDDFQSAFGKEFARAYEEQVKKL
ncbi:type VI secretion system-associated FHA domain protein TagH [Cognatiyoonia sp. IB215446]|uniref:type VI secretion system-associated FHA domain protein TagH n=1 Tax=Cognatiyoonia sp. IB215446 TaxID=3097355 RepID=UPI002A13FF48|nr:type VI secretion system-associated FHA domain protein TagH [Cognatiyoonia sp. IB215446]MDX8346874.1 type VI secretion system-associated FHA domain protein TagH [Cognatiyoonia sp. IB215446]